MNHKDKLEVTSLSYGVAIICGTQASSCLIFDAVRYFKYIQGIKAQCFVILKIEAVTNIYPAFRGIHDLHASKNRPVLLWYWSMHPSDTSHQPRPLSSKKRNYEHRYKVLASSLYCVSA
jgi:hypothetical protein